MTRGKPVYPFPEIFNNMGTQGFLGIPYSIYFMVIIVIIGHFYLHTMFMVDISMLLEEVKRHHGYQG